MRSNGPREKYRAYLIFLFEVLRLGIFTLSLWFASERALLVATQFCYLLFAAAATAAASAAAGCVHVAVFNVMIPLAPYFSCFATEWREEG